MNDSGSRRGGSGNSNVPTFKDFPGDREVARRSLPRLTHLDELEANGLIVDGIVANGKLAVDMTLELKPDVVLMDITRPKTEGIDAAVAIQVGCPTPVVILTAHAETELLVKATAAGVGAFVLMSASGSLSPCGLLRRKQSLSYPVCAAT